MTPPNAGSAEPFYTFKEIAALLNLPAWKVQRGAKAGLFRTYTFGNSRQYALLSEVLAAVRGAQ